jgi:hypothetical protein
MDGDAGEKSNKIKGAPSRGDTKIVTVLGGRAIDLACFIPKIPIISGQAFSPASGAHVSQTQTFQHFQRNKLAADGGDLGDKAG